MVLTPGRRRRALTCGAALAAVLTLGCASAEGLPYDATNPVVYDNDGAIESGFTDVYVMALASAGVIDLKGIITTCSYGEAKRRPPFSPVPEASLTRERRELIEKARRSGLTVPVQATAGCSLSLKRPESERIEDTPSFGSPGSRLIVRCAREATPEKPLVVLMGGQATTVVDAYLLDNSIADRMVLAWIVGNKTSEGAIDAREYNAGVDAWATYVAFEKLRVVAFPFSNDGNDANDGLAATPKSRLGELPETELRQTMMEARWPRSAKTYSEPHHDYDAMPIIALTRPDYIETTKHFSFDHWYQSRGGEKLPLFTENPEGRALVVWACSPAVATDEWWRRVCAPAAWGPSEGQVPFGGTPWPVPGKIEAEHFDEGGTGVAYSDTTNNLTHSEWFNPIRFLEHADILACASAGGGYKVGRTAPGEWMEYTVRVADTGTYEMTARVASEGPGGTFHVEADGAPCAARVTVPDTGGWEKWQDVSQPGLRLAAGVHVLRVVMDSAGPEGNVADFDCFSLKRPEDVR